MIENDCLPSRVVSSWFRGCLYIWRRVTRQAGLAELKKHCLYETESPDKHEEYVLKWATSTRQITKLCK